jgi:hypothetical protein
MSEARINRISNELGTGGPIVSGITTFSNVNYFVPPRGTTSERPSNCPPGSIRFNTDSAHLEYFDGLQWLEMEAFNNELGVSGALGNRGVWGGGYSPSSTVDYITISTLGNSSSFGNLATSRAYLSACASSTRGVFGNGYAGSSLAAIDYITFSSTGNATSFGSSTQARNKSASFSSQIRGIWAGGDTPETNIIDYITIASTGNAVDFGDLYITSYGASGCSSTTRGIIAGGAFASPSGGVNNVIQYVTISTLGNSIDFGDLVTVKYIPLSCSNATRALFGGGYNSPSINNIDFITIASTGNAQDFGDLTSVRGNGAGCSSSTRGVFGAGSTTNIIDYVTISSTGDAQDFGDLASAKRFTSACSNGHGGL